MHSNTILKEIATARAETLREAVRPRTRTLARRGR